MRFLASALILLSYEATAGAILADWQCLSGPSFPVEVTIDQRGVRLEPKIFDSQRRYEANEGLSDCIEAFRQRVSQSVATFKGSNCTSSGSDPICQSNLEAVNARVTEHIRRSELLRRNRITLGVLSGTEGGPTGQTPSGGGTADGEPTTPTPPNTGTQPTLTGGNTTRPTRPGPTGQTPPGGELAVTPPGPTPGNELPSSGTGTVAPLRPSGGNVPPSTTGVGSGPAVPGIETPQATGRPPQGTPRPTTTDVNRFLREEIAAGRINPSNPSGTFEHNGRTHRLGDYENTVGDGMSDLFNRVDRRQASQTLQNYMMGRLQLMQGNSRERTDVMANLQRLFNQLHGRRGQEEMARAMQECLQPPTGQSIQDILSQLQNSTRDRGCGELPPGQVRLNNSSVDQSQFLLRRRPDGHYQALVNIYFRQGPGATISNQDMMNRARSCLAQANLNMRGPNGQMLEIVLATPEEAGQIPWSNRPRERWVDVVGPGVRATSSSFNSDINCSTVTHEVLHHLGLCDEYEDRVPYTAGSSAIAPARSPNAPLPPLVYSCRPTPARATIMNYNDAFFEQAVPTTVTCSCNSSQCRAASRGDERMRQAFFGAKFLDLVPLRLRAGCVMQPGSPGPIPGGASVSVTPQSRSSVIYDESTVVVVGSRPQITTQRRICTCSPNDNPCLVEIELLQRVARNPGYTSQCPMFETPMPASRGAGPRAVARPSVSLQNNQVTIQNPPRVSSMLEPNHFHKILEGTCTGGQSAAYQTCAAYAYTNFCSQIPPQCQNPEHFLGSRQ